MLPIDDADRRPARPVSAAEAWKITADRPDRCALFFDFDGTLAPVQDDPTAVFPVPGVTEALSALARVVGRVAIVSARPVEFLRDRFPGMPDVDLYGLYGLERSHGGGVTETDPTALAWEPTMAELADLARAELPEGAGVEYKRLSVALHYRRAPHLRDAVERWGRAQADRLGATAQGGRMVVELKPPVRLDKGTVLHRALNGFDCAWYFGDDVSDLQAFAAVRARAAGDAGFLGVCVAVANPETGHEVSSSADLTLDSPVALAGFLRTGLALLTAPTGTPDATAH
ncbi:trehalose-phosphatase [Rhizomonospora bruguierae]|uniref:trehalose-phosphatase n=1 Tax=Rhizomonospora bruguierae TaxID=1581705 RepID=UPI001BCA7E91|nr:trehalose-phosphatase [Micromonospora sp. NBRC 107566]